MDFHLVIFLFFAAIIFHFSYSGFRAGLVSACVGFCSLTSDLLAYLLG